MEKSKMTYKVSAIGKCDNCRLGVSSYDDLEEKPCFVFAYTGVATLICIDCLREIVEQFARETKELIRLESAGT